MKKFAVAALAACLATTLSAKQPEMTVTANPSFNAWVDDASRSLDQALDRVNMARSETGITYVQFTCDESGKPQNIRTVGGGRPFLARAGREAVRSIRTLHPMFEGAKPNQLVEAAIIVAANQEQLDSMLAKVKERAIDRNSKLAARGLPNSVVSLAVVAGF
jgi:hypothetical protein